MAAYYTISYLFPFRWVAPLDAYTRWIISSDASNWVEYVMCRPWDLRSFLRFHHVTYAWHSFWHTYRRWLDLQFLIVTERKEKKRELNLIYYNKFQKKKVWYVFQTNKIKPNRVITALEEIDKRNERFHRVLFNEAYKYLLDDLPSTEPTLVFRPILLHNTIIQWVHSVETQISSSIQCKGAVGLIFHHCLNARSSEMRVKKKHLRILQSKHLNILPRYSRSYQITKDHSWPRTRRLFWIIFHRFIEEIYTINQV